MRRKMQRTARKRRKKRWTTTRIRTVREGRWMVARLRVRRRMRRRLRRKRRRARERMMARKLRWMARTVKRVRLAVTGLGVRAKDCNDKDLRIAETAGAGAGAGAGGAVEVLDGL